MHRQRRVQKQIDEWIHVFRKPNLLPAQRAAHSRRSRERSGGDSPRRHSLIKPVVEDLQREYFDVTQAGALLRTVK
jgi:hypothetical protein